MQSYKKEKTAHILQKKILPPSQKTGTVHTDNYQEFIRARADLRWNHDTSTPHRSETKRGADNAARRAKEGTSALLVQSGLSEKWCGRSDGVLLLFAKHARQKWQTERQRTKDDLELHLMVQGHHLGLKFMLIQCLRNTKVVIINLVQR